MKSIKVETSADEKKDKILDDSAVEEENESKSVSGIPEEGESSHSEDGNGLAETMCDLPVSNLLEFFKLI